MPELSFYILQSESFQERCFFACKLIEKAYQSGQYCYVLMDSLPEVQMLDERLWTFRPGSFIPHDTATQTLPTNRSQVLIGTQPPPIHWRGVVVNLSSHLPAHWEDFTRLLEILDNSEATKIAGRQRYSTYKQAGVTITTHKINLTSPTNV